jgi:hypothetical protein
MSAAPHPRPAVRNGAGSVAALLLLVVPCFTGMTHAQVPVLQSGRLGGDEEIRVDGLLDDPAWQRVEWFGDFVQSVPEFGEPATEPTHVAFLFDDRNVYIAVRCNDSQPGAIRARKLRHRDDPDTDDHLQLVFDTYRDQIRGTVFVVNPLGAKEEGLVNGYMRYTWDWNEVWQVKTAITDSGWQAEFRIPLRLLRYRKSQQQEWGVNVKRVVRRLQEESYLAPVPPPYDISSLNFAGILAGIELGKRQRNLQFIPYALGGVLWETDDATGEESTDTIEEAGLDIKYSITSDLTLDFTANTDFAQVESDDQQVNLSRFSLFFPEKREFFLENADLFRFGQSWSFPGHAPDVTPFFSRRIGLYEGSTVPITAGVRLTGKTGRQDIGLLSIGTGDVPELELDSAWYNVARVRRDLGGRSYIGGIITDSRRGEFRSRTAGVDGSWFLTQDLSLFGDFLVVDDNGTDESTTASYLALDLTTDRWGFLFSFREVEQGFDPDLGFVRRDGYRKKDASVRHSFRPAKGGIRRVTIRPNGSEYDSLVYGARESSDINLNLELEFDNGDEFQVRASREFERLFEEFELDESLVFPAGDYTFEFVRLSYESDRSRKWGGEASFVDGEFYDGDQRQLEGELWLVFNRHFRVNGSYATFDISAEHGAIDWQLWAFRLDYTCSSTLSASGFVQHNSSTGNTDLNLRLRKILRNDSDLFVVLNEREFEDPALGTLRERDLAVKVSYRFFL